MASARPLLSTWTKSPTTRLRTSGCVAFATRGWGGGGALGPCACTAPAPPCPAVPAESRTCPAHLAPVFPSPPPPSRVLQFLREALGDAAVPQPLLNLGSAFKDAANAAFNTTLHPSFSPYKGDVPFYLGGCGWSGWVWVEWVGRVGGWQEGVGARASRL